jgi:dTDP-4-dehydrorhamnose reductase
LEQHQPWAVINAAGYVRVDDAEREVERCYRENVIGPAMLARECARRQLPLVTFSTDLVFDGERRFPYRETDRVNPLNVYGRTKAEAEQTVLSIHREALVVRTSAFFGPWDEYNFVVAVLTALARNERFTASPTIVSPTYIPDLANGCLDLLIDGESGIWHLASAGETSWHKFARYAAERAGFDAALIESRPLNGNSAPRPAYSALSSEKAILLPTWEDGLERFFAELQPKATGGIAFALPIAKAETQLQGACSW